MVKSDYLKERLVRFDHRLKDYDFDFFARAIVGAETVVVSPCPVFVTPKDRVVETAPGEDPVKTFSLEQEYLRRNFNEFADSSYLTPERVRLLRYLRCLHVLDSDPALVRQGFAPRDYNNMGERDEGLPLRLRRLAEPQAHQAEDGIETRSRAARKAKNSQKTKRC